MGERLTREEEDAIACMSAAALDGNGTWARMALDRLQAELDAVRAERDEALAATADWRQAMVVREVAAEMRAHDEKLDAAIDRAERAEALAAEERERGHEALRKGLAAAQEKHDAMRAAEAGLAALREAAQDTSDGLTEYYDPQDPDIYSSYELRCALSDTAQAAEAYTRRVRAEGIEAAARRVGEAIKGPIGWVGITDGQEQHVREWLEAVAADERGGR